MTNKRIYNAIEIIKYAIDNQLSLNKASELSGYSSTYVKNVKFDIQDRYENNIIDDEIYSEFMDVYTEYKKKSVSWNNKTFTNNLKAAKKPQNDDELDLNSGEDKERVDFENYCKKNKIDIENVITYWHKSKNYSIYVRNDEERINKRFNELKEILKQETQVVRRIRPNIVQSDLCSVINIYDLHIDKKSYKSNETGIIELIEVKDTIKNKFIDILDTIKIYKPKELILPVGNDLLNTNGFTPETLKGTPQQVLVGHDTAFRQALELCKFMIDSVVNIVNCPVRVPVIFGNHSKHAEFYLGLCLEIMYDNNENVIIDNTYRDRKYIVFEDIIFGFAHGDKYKNKISQLPLLLMQENRNIISETKYSQFYLGDIHHKQEYKFVKTKDFGSCNISFLRGNSVTDQWHDDNGYIGVPRTIESYIWEKEKGQTANFSINF